MNKISVEKLGIFVIVYFDDILIYTDKTNYVNTVWWFINQLKEYFWYYNLKKCHFCQEEIQVYGYVIFLESFSIENEQIDALHNWLEP